MTQAADSDRNAGQTSSGHEPALPIAAMLRALGEESDSRRVARGANQLADLIEQGVPLPDAVDQVGRGVPPEIKAAIAAGVECGDLPAVIEDYHAMGASRREHRRLIYGAILYPVFCMVLLLPVLFLFSVFILPMFRAMFEEFALELPSATINILRVGRWLPWAILGTFGGVGGILLLLSCCGARAARDRLQAAIPLTGRLVAWSGQHDFAFLLASFVRRRLPTDQAVLSAADASPDHNVRQAARRVAEQVRNGEPLARAIASSMHFDRHFAQLVAWGEQHDLLPDAITAAADDLRARIRDRSALIRRIVPPAAMLFIAAAAFITITSLMLPLFDLISGLAG